jgi:DNA invertase Pin-like site-specific DNA recombinase
MKSPIATTVLYLRYSRHCSTSIEDQRRDLEELAAIEGLVIVGEYVDAVESDKGEVRPGFRSLLAGIRMPSRTWDHILALDTAHIARRHAFSFIFEEQECKGKGIKVVYKTPPESDPISEMLIKSILQAIDEFRSLTSHI